MAGAAFLLQWCLVSLRLELQLRTVVQQNVRHPGLGVFARLRQRRVAGLGLRVDIGPILQQEAHQIDLTLLGAGAIVGWVVGNDVARTSPPSDGFPPVCGKEVVIRRR